MQGYWSYLKNIFRSAITLFCLITGTMTILSLLSGREKLDLATGIFSLFLIFGIQYYNEIESKAFKIVTLILTIIITVFLITNLFYNL